MRNKLDT